MGRLRISAKSGESIFLNELVEVQIVGVERGRVKLLFIAPNEVSIKRQAKRQSPKTLSSEGTAPSKNPKFESE